MTCGRATMSYGSDDTLDMAPAGVDKGSGVRRALAALGVDPTDAIGYDGVAAWLRVALPLVSATPATP